jgi:adenosine deaminase
MLEAGILLTLNSDDPTMLRYELGDEYATVAATFGLGIDQLEGICLGGVQASWMDEVDKARLRTSFAAEFATLRQEYLPDADADAGADEVGVGAAR